MKVCVCRNISDSDYKTEHELKSRLLEDDVCCRKCVEFYEKVREVRERKLK